MIGNMEDVAYPPKNITQRSDCMDPDSELKFDSTQQRSLVAAFGIAEHASRFCATCLAADRALYSLSHSPQYVSVCNGLTLSFEDAVCFECRARLRQFLKFRHRALCAQRALAARVAAQLRCLSTLRCTVTQPYSFALVDEVEVAVKEEPLVDCLVTAEPLAPPVVHFDHDYDDKEDEKQDVDIKPDQKHLGIDDSETDTASETEESPTAMEQYNSDFVLCAITEDEYRAHMRRERASPRYRRARNKCAQCALVFYSERHLRVHKPLHSPSRGKIKCKVCQQRFKSQHSLQLHSVSHRRRFQCRYCPAVEYTYKKMYEHYRTEHDTATRQCTLCDQQFGNYHKLRQHIRLTHNERHACTVCSRSFTSKQIQQRHMLMAHTKVSDVECDICHKKYKGEFNLKKHILYSHQNEKRPDENAYCAECDMQFPSVNSYKNHLRVAARHASVQLQRFECDYCGKRCKEKASLRTHIELKHLKLSRYQCDVCQQSFPTVAYLRRHKRTKHSTAAPLAKRYVCHLCEKAFTIRKSLVEHTNTHLGLRPFHCKLCEATFAYSAALYNHNRLVHLKAKVARPRDPPGQPFWPHLPAQTDHGALEH